MPKKQPSTLIIKNKSLNFLAIGTILLALTIVYFYGISLNSYASGSQPSTTTSSNTSQNPSQATPTESDPCEDIVREIVVTANRILDKMENCTDGKDPNFNKDNQPCQDVTYEEWQRLNYMMGLNASIDKGAVDLLKFTDFDPKSIPTNITEDVKKEHDKLVKDYEKQLAKYQTNLKSRWAVVSNITPITSTLKYFKERFNSHTNPTPEDSVFHEDLPFLYFNRYDSADFSFPNQAVDDSFITAIDSGFRDCNTNGLKESKGYPRLNFFNQDQQQKQTITTDDIKNDCLKESGRDEVCKKVLHEGGNESLTEELKQNCLDMFDSKCEIEAIQVTGAWLQPMDCSSLTRLVQQMTDIDAVQKLYDHYKNNNPDWLCMTENEKDAAGYYKDLPDSRYSNDMDYEEMRKKLEEELEDAESACAQTGFHAMVTCPLTRFAGKTADKTFSLLRLALAFPEDALEPDSSLNQAWMISRTYANSLLIIIGLILIVMQMASIGSQQRLSQIIPQFIITAILINISFFLCSLAVNIANIIGDNISIMFSNLADEAFASKSPLADIVDLALKGKFFILAGGAVAVTVAASFFGALSLVLPLLIGALVTAVAALAAIAARHIAIVILIFLSPLAIALMALPNTKNLSSRWLKLFITMLAIYPIIAFLFGFGDLAYKITWSTKASGFRKLISISFAFIPLLIAPKLIIQLISKMPLVSGSIRNLGKLGDKAASSFKRSDLGQSIQQADYQQRRKNVENVRGKIKTGISGVTGRTEKEVVSRIPSLANLPDTESVKKDMSEISEQSERIDKDYAKNFVISNITPTSNKSSESIINHVNPTEVRTILENALTAADGGALTEQQLTISLQIAEKNGYSQEFINNFALEVARKLSAEGSHTEAAMIMYKLNHQGNKGNYLEAGKDPGGFTWTSDPTDTSQDSQKEQAVREYFSGLPTYQVKPSYAKQKDYNGELRKISRDLAGSSLSAEKRADLLYKQKNMRIEQQQFEDLLRTNPTFRNQVEARVRSTTTMPDGKKYVLDRIDDFS